MTSNEVLARWIAERRIQLRLIISTPRSSSTVLEMSLLETESANCGIIDPFDRVSYERQPPSVAYDYILSVLLSHNGVDSLHQFERRFPPGAGAVVIIKEMTHQVCGHEYGPDMGKDVFYQFIDHLPHDVPVLFNMRNPYLQIESRIIRMCEHVTRVHSPSLCAFLQPNGAHDDLAHQVSSLDAWARPFLHNPEGTPGTPWTLICEQSIQSQDYSLLEPPLSQVLEPDRNGWKQLEMLVKWMDETDRPFILTDSTVFRLRPDDVLQTLGDRLKIEFVNRPSVFQRPDRTSIAAFGMDEFRQWYRRAEESHKVEKPTEFAIRSLDRFPTYLREYLSEAETIYTRLLTRPELLRPHSLVAGREVVPIKRTPAVHRALLGRGAFSCPAPSLDAFLRAPSLVWHEIEGELQLVVGHDPAHASPAPYDGLSHVGVPLHIVDPIFSQKWAR